MFIVGIDVAKRNHEVTVITSEGQVVCKAFRISNTCTGYNRMMERLGKLTNLKGQFIFAMESTAHYWLALYTRLKKDGYQVVILNPIQTHTMREMFLRKSKTDAKDSLVIADCEGVYATSILLLLKQIRTLQEKCGMLETQIGALLQQFDTTLTTIPRIGPIFTVAILSAIDDISRLSSVDKLAAYIGVDSSVNQSGEFVGTHAHIFFV